MIERYTLPEMGQVWSEAHKYQLWCQVEAIVLEAHARRGDRARRRRRPVPPPAADTRGSRRDRSGHASTTSSRS